jgi:dGTPase
MPQDQHHKTLATSVRAPFASCPGESRGRLFAEPESASRTAFQRDRDRIIHATAFRRLKQKTQVFVAHEGDTYRTRLTHSLEVAQIARSIARTLRLDEDLAEALALAHDLGHPPFGHAGETALDQCMAKFGGFDHNVQTLRVLTSLERRYPAFDGLNLSWETLEGVVKHNGPLIGRGRSRDDVAAGILSYDSIHSLDLGTFAGPEAQVAALADDIAYNNHDIDDGLAAGLFEIEEIKGLPLVGDVFRQVETDWPGLDRGRLIAEAVRRLIGIWVTDLVQETSRAIDVHRPQTADDVRGLGVPLVAFSAAMREEEQVLRKFLFERMYRHWKVNRMMSQARRVVKELFELFLTEPNTLPPSWRELSGDSGSPETARVVCDYIASMTDTFALEEHRKLFNLERWI